jgi:transcriptional regulator with XRE-family HTH domain
MTHSGPGWLIREWRAVRGLSQAALAGELSTTQRHLSFIETGRSIPSREMLMKVAAVLAVPPRDRNALLASAGLQAVHRATPLSSPQGVELRHALDLVLRQNEPFASMAVDRDFRLVMCNRGFAQYLAIFADLEVLPYAVLDGSLDTIDLILFNPRVKQALRNWRDVVHHLIWRVRAELALRREPSGQELFSRIKKDAELAPLLVAPPDIGQGFVIPMELRLNGQLLRFFTTLTTLGTPQDLSACELHIESYHPADDASARFVRDASVPL